MVVSSGKKGKKILPGPTTKQASWHLLNNKNTGAVGTQAPCLHACTHAWALPSLTMPLPLCPSFTQTLTPVLHTLLPFTLPHHLHVLLFTACTCTTSLYTLTIFPSLFHSFLLHSFSIPLSFLLLLLRIPLSLVYPFGKFLAHPSDWPLPGDGQMEQTPFPKTPLLPSCHTKRTEHSVSFWWKVLPSFQAG